MDNTFLLNFYFKALFSLKDRMISWLVCYVVVLERLTRCADQLTFVWAQRNQNPENCGKQSSFFSNGRCFRGQL